MTARILVSALLGLTLSIGTATAAPKVFRYALSSDLNNLDPHTSATTSTGQLGLMVYDTLFALDATLQPKPQMVETYTVSSDKLTYAFTLRPNLRFHDGQAVTGADVVASMKRWMERDTMGAQLKARLADFRLEGERGFVIALKEPFAFVELALASTGANQPVIMRRADAETDPFKPLTHAVGSGPFKFVEWKPGLGATFDRNPDYTPRAEPPDGLAGGKVVKVDRVEMKFIPDANTRASALINNEIDLFEQVPGDVLPILEGSSDVVLKRSGPSLQTYIRPNHLVPPFNNVKARQALALLVNQSDYMLAGYGTKDWWQADCFSFFLCGTPTETDAGSEAYRGQNLAKAKQLLAESGYKGEKIVILATRELPGQGALADVTTANLRAIGANVDLQILDFGGMLSRRTRKEPVGQGGWNLFHIAVTSVVMYSPLMNFVIDSRCDGKNYVGWPCSDQIEALRREYGSLADESARKLKLEELSRALWAELPYIPTGQYWNPTAWRKEVTGLVDASHLVFWNVDKK